MVRKIAYWGSTGLACLALFVPSVTSPAVNRFVAGFTKAGYPQ